MENENTPTLTKDIFVKLFSEWINQRPGLDPRDYGCSISAYRSEANRIAKDGIEARARLDAVNNDWTPFSPELLFQACDYAFSGRLQIKHSEKGWYIDYTTGQYWPTEYRQAAAAVLDLYGDLLYRAAASLANS